MVKLDPWGEWILYGLAVVALSVFFFKLSTRLKIRWRLFRLKQENEIFGWQHIQNRLETCFLEVHSISGPEMLEESKTFMTGALGETTERTFFDLWERENLVSMIDMERIYLMKPVFLDIKSTENGYDGSTIKVLMVFHKEDYLVDSETGEIFDLKKSGLKPAKKICTMAIKAGEWRLARIDDKPS